VPPEISHRRGVGGGYYRIENSKPSNLLKFVKIDTPLQGFGAYFHVTVHAITGFWGIVHAITGFWGGFFVHYRVLGRPNLL
jgi:hypothetical protein